MEIDSRLLVFGDTMMVRGKELRTLVAAPSRASAAQALSEAGICVTVGHVALYWSPTWDDKELEIARAKPGAVMQEKTPRSGNFVQLTKA